MKAERLYRSDRWLVEKFPLASGAMIRMCTCGKDNLSPIASGPFIHYAVEPQAYLALRRLCRQGDDDALSAFAAMMRT